MSVGYYIDPSGEVVELPAEQAQSAGALGYVPASPAQVADFQRADAYQKKYGTTGQQIITGVEGAASALTLGASTAVERALGVSAEDIAGRQEVNPVAHGVGTGIGIAAPLVLTAGAAAPVSAGMAAAKGAARLTAPSLIARAGQAVTRGVESALPEATGLLGKVAAKAAAVGAGSAVEGAAYGLGHVVHETSLGNPNMTAQSAMAEIGLAALLGGGLGAAVGIGEIGIPAMVRGARDVVGRAFKKAETGIENLYGSAQGVTGTPGDVATIMLEHKQEISALEQIVPGVSKDISNSTPEMAQWVLKNGNKLSEMEQAFPGTTRQLARTSTETADYLLENWQKIITDPKQRVEIATGLGDGMQKVIDETNRVMKRLNTEIAPGEASKLLAEANPQAGYTAYSRIFNKVEDAVSRMRSEPELFNPSYARHLEGVREGLVRDAQAMADPLEAFTRLKTLRQSLDEAIPYTKDPGALGLSDRNAIDALKALRKEAKAILTDEAVFGQAAARRAALDDAQSEWFALMNRGGDFNAKFMRKSMGRGGVSYEVKPTKVNTWLNQMADTRGQDFAETWGRTMDAARKVLDEAEKSHAVAQVGNFDRAAVEGLINKTGELTADARKRAAVTQVKNQLDPKMSWGSMPIASPEQQLLTGAMNMVLPGMVTGTVNATVNLAKSMTSVPRAVQVLAAFERMGQSLSNQIDSAASTLVRGGARAADIGRGEVSAGLARSFGKTPAESAAEFAKRTHEISRLANDPTQMEDALTQQSEHTHAHAPETSQAMNVATARAVGFLKSKLPQPPQLGPLAGKWTPNRAEISAFNRYYEAVNKPTSILKQAAAGTLTPEAIEAVKTVYPELYAKMQQAIVNKLAQHPGKAPYRARLMLSMMLGQDVDGTTDRTFIQKNQMALQGPSAKGPMDQLGGGIKPTAKGASAITLADRTLTPGQASSQRR